MAALLQKFFNGRAETAHRHGAAEGLRKRPGFRTQLAVMAATLSLFAATAITTPAFAQDNPPPAAIEQNTEQNTEQAQDSVIVTSPDNFQRDVIDASSDRPLLLYIYAPGCDYCDRYGPVLEMEAELADDVRLVKLNIDEYPEFTWGTFKDMQGVPYVAVFAHGLFIDKAAGAPPEGREFEAAQSVVNYARDVWQLVGDQLKAGAPEDNVPESSAKAKKKQPAKRAGM